MSPIKRLFQFIDQEKGAFRLSIFYSILNKIFDLMPPIMIGWAVDSVNGGTPAWISDNFDVSTPLALGIFFAVLIAVVFIIESIFEWLFSLGFMRIAQRIQHRLRIRTYAHLQEREIAYFEKQRTGNIMAIVNDDVNQLERFLNTSVNEIVQITTLYIFAAFTMGAMSWKLTLFSLFPIPFILMGSRYYQAQIGPFYTKIRDMVGALAARLENNISGILVIKSFTAEAYEYQRVEQASEDYLRANDKAIKWNAGYIPIIRMFIAIGFGLGMMLGIYWALTGQENFTAGKLTFFAMMIQRILWPITRLGRVFDDYERAKASAQRIFELLDSPNQLEVNENIQSLPDSRGAIRFENVHFHYEEALPILRGINLSIQPGSSVGIAGTTGSGKTTLIKLLLRLYDSTAGNIIFDEIPVRDIHPQTLREQIAVVSQDVYLFHGSIGENIAYGQKDYDLEAIKQAAKEAQLHDFIMSLPKGYDSIVGERGIKLSGGQRQRLSIARAILKDAPVLILDEATSAVDTETEREIQEKLDELIEGKTAFIIAHRLSTIRHCDKIIVLQKGQIIEEGEHEDLLLMAGSYADLWDIQVGNV